MSTQDPLGDLLVSLRASADAFSADMKKVQTSATSTTNAIVAGWGKSGEAADTAVRRMEQRAANKAILKEFDATTAGVVKGWAKSGDAAQAAAQKTGRSFDQAGSALKSLEQMLGIQLPNAAGKFLEKSAAIGPILTGAFSAIAVVGLIQALSQLPALFDKIAGAITGWDAAAKKAYASFLEENKKAVEAAEQLRLKIVEINFGKGASLQAAIAAQTAENQRNLQTIIKINDKLREQERIAKELEAAGFAGGMAGLTREDAALLQKAQDDAIAGGQKLLALRAQLTTETMEGQKKTSDDLSKKQKQAAEETKRFNESTQAFWANALQQFRNQAFDGGETVKAGLQVAEATVKRILDKEKERLQFIKDQTEEFIKQQQFWDKALQEFRNQIPEDVKAGEEVGRANAKAIIDASQRAQKAYEDVFQSVKSTASQAFLDILRDGELSFKKLGGVISGIFRTLAAEILSTMTAKLITPLIAQFSGMLGKIPGLGGVFGGAAAGGGGAAAGGIGGGAGAAGTLSAAKFGAFFTNPFTIAAAGGILGATAWLKSQAHHEANTFVKTLEKPFGAELARIVASTEDATGRLADLESVWTDFSQAAQQFAQAGSDEATVVQQALAHLDPLVNRIRGDLQNQINALPGLQQVQQNPATQTIIMNMDGRTVARLIIPSLYALTRNEGMVLVGAR